MAFLEGRRFVMSEQWKDNGVCCNMSHDFLNAIIPGEDTNSHKVENIETGEERQIRVDSGQTVGDAIAKGQWED